MRLIQTLLFVSLSLLGFQAHAIDQMYNWNGLEFVTVGNVTHVHPSKPESTILRGGWELVIDDVEPRATATHPVPHKNTGGTALAKIEVKPPINPAKVADAATKAAGAAVAGAATGNPYVAVGSVVCAFVCAPLIEALADWGATQFRKNTDGSISLEVPDPQAPVVISDGRKWATTFPQYIYWSQAQACASLGGVPATGTGGCNIPTQTGGTRYVSVWNQASTCSNGTPVVNGECGADIPKAFVPMETYLDSNYRGKGWDHHWAGITAGLVASGVNVFSDGTSTSITGPSVVPVSSSEAKTPLALLPGTTTPAPTGHTGPTDSGTQTTTTTTTAKNTFNPAPLSEGSPGVPASGPSMTTTQQTTTTTSITNNVTNITNIVNETTTEKDEAPDEPPTDTPFGELPELYKQKYPDGLMGVMRTQMTAMKATPLFSLPMQMMGDLPQTGQCPSWRLNLSFALWADYGTFDVGADCAIWEFASWVVVISAIVLARQLVFGG